MQASEYIFIDDAIITDIFGYLASIQSPNGSFPELGRVIHTSMLGGVDSELTLTVRACTLLSITKNIA